MADQRRMRRLSLALVEQRLQAAGWAVQEEGFDGGRHNTLLPENYGFHHEGIAVIARHRRDLSSWCDRFSGPQTPAISTNAHDAALVFADTEDRTERRQVRLRIARQALPGTPGDEGQSRQGRLTGC